MLCNYNDFLLKIPDSDLAIYDRVLPNESPLLDAMEVIDWVPLEKEVEKYYSKDEGQPAIKPLIMLKLEYLRYQYRLSDREVIARSQTDLLFRWFLQVPIRYRLPVPTSLTKFRGRLGAEGFKAVFDQLVAAARAQGLVQDRLRLKDATHILANIAVPTTLKLLAQLRCKMLDVIRPIDPHVAKGFDIEVERVRLDTAQAEPEIKLQERLTLVVEILSWLHEQSAPPPETPEYRLWEKLLSVRQLAEKVVDDCQHPGQGDRTLSVVDPDARRGMHGSFYDGYLLDVMMDADSQLITELEILPANGQEAIDAVHLVEMEHETHGNQIEQLSIDAAGFHGPSLRELEDPAGLAVDVITPPRDFSPPDRFSSTDFELTDDGDRVTCPAGETSRVGWTKKDKPNSVFFDFSTKTCANCPLLSQCHPDLKPTSHQGRRVCKNEYEPEYERARQKSRTAAYQEVRREHPSIERKLNEIVRHHAGRRAWYWGAAKVKAQQTMTCFAINIKRMIKLTKGVSCASHPCLA